MNPTRLPSPTLLSLALVAAMGAAIAAPGPASARRVIARPPPDLATCGPLRERLIDMAAQQAVDRRYGFFWRYNLRGVEVATADTSAKGGSGPAHHTTTNNQEQGVDEADTLKSDGKYIYTISGDQVLILDSWPVTSMSVVARYTLADGATPISLLLRGDQLVVLARVHATTAQPDDAIATLIAPRRPRPIDPAAFYGTRIAVLDVANRRRPRLTSTVDVEGWMAQARLIGDDVYVVSNASLRVPPSMARAAQWFARRLPPMPIGDYDWNDVQKLRADGLPKVRAYLAAKFRRASLRGAMPRMRSGGAGGNTSALVPMYGCNQIIAPGVTGSSDQLGVLNLAHIDLDMPRAVHNTGVFGGGYQVYASTRAIYVAAPVAGGANRWGGIDVAPLDSRGRTRIVKFDLGLRGWSRPRYAATGVVPGTLLNQFSMSEHRGFLRVATTDQQWFDGGQRQLGGNNLFVLGQRRGALVTVGQITGLARGERIYSARMIGDKGYVVTFRQTDPLFTLDLSDPQNPEVVGELKINGFSSYIHPLGADRLLTIGRDADSDGRVKGVQLQIFDVSDPARPVRTHQQLLSHFGSSWSAASWDHKAFTFDPVTRTLALPLSTYDHRSPERRFSGVIVYAVDDRSGFEELGRISHDSGQQTYTDWREQINRSMVIDDALVTVSPGALQVHDLSALAGTTKPIRAVSLLR